MTKHFYFSVGILVCGALAADARADGDGDGLGADDEPAELGRVAR